MKNPTKTKSKFEQLRKHLTSKKSITTWQAIQLYRITRLSGYIHRLRMDYGWNISGTWREEDGIRWMVYKLQK